MYIDYTGVFTVKNIMQTNLRVNLRVVDIPLIHG